MAWITSTQVADALGLPVSADPFLNECTDAANAYCFRRRQKAGYDDDPDVSPGADVSMGTIIYAEALFRERGAVDSYPSFDAFAAGAVPSASMGQVNRLLGTPRPQVDSAATDWPLMVNPLRVRRPR
jgi:hypothetical protein